MPATLAVLQQLVADRSMHAVNATASSVVTPTLRESYAEGDDDELADVALRDAALASLRLLAAEDGESGLPLTAGCRGGRGRRCHRAAGPR